MLRAIAAGGLLYVYSEGNLNHISSGTVPWRAANLAAAAFQAALDRSKSLPEGRLQPKLAALQNGERHTDDLVLTVA
jgi:hypothetical protein